MRPSSFFVLLAVSSGALLLACSAEETTAPAASPATTTEAPIPATEADPSTEEPSSKDAAPPKAEPGTKGCALAPAGPGTFAKKMTTAAGKPRAYHLSVPSSAKTRQLLDVVFVLHGAGDNAPQNMRDWFAVEAKVPSALGIYPQALPRTRADGSGGNIPRWDLSGNEDLAFFDAMLAEISELYCVDRDHVFVTGFSSGGNFSQHLACLRPKDVKGMAVVAGPGPFTDACGGAVPTWMTHDVNDDALPVKDARSSRDFWASQNGCGKTTWSDLAGRPECKRNSSCTKGALVYCETTGVGHDVPTFAVSAIADFFGGLSP